MRLLRLSQFPIPFNKDLLQLEHLLLLSLKLTCCGLPRFPAFVGSNRGPLVLQSGRNLFFDQFAITRELILLCADRQFPFKDVSIDLPPKKWTGLSCF